MASLKMPNYRILLVVCQYFIAFSVAAHLPHTLAKSGALSESESHSSQSSDCKRPSDEDLRQRLLDAYKSTNTRKRRSVDTESASQSELWNDLTRFVNDEDNRDDVHGTDSATSHHRRTKRHASSTHHRKSTPNHQTKHSNHGHNKLTTQRSTVAPPTCTFHQNITTMPEDVFPRDVYSGYCLPTSLAHPYLALYECKPKEHTIKVMKRSIHHGCIDVSTLNNPDAWEEEWTVENHSVTYGCDCV